MHHRLNHNANGLNDALIHLTVTSPVGIPYNSAHRHEPVGAVAFIHQG